METTVNKVYAKYNKYNTDVGVDAAWSYTDIDK